MTNDKEWQKAYYKAYRQRKRLHLIAKDARRSREQAKQNRKKVSDWRKSARGKELRKLQYERSKEKDKARRLAKQAVESGELKKGLCVLCGSIDTQAHHDDYSKLFGYAIKTTRFLRRLKE